MTAVELSVCRITKYVTMDTYETSFMLVGRNMEDEINSRTLLKPFNHQVMSDDIDDIQDPIYQL